MNCSTMISPNQKKNYLLRHKTCCKCGNKSTTIDHIIPCHVLNITIDNEFLFRQAIRDRDNWQAMCTKCNKNKSSTFNLSEVPDRLYSKYKEYVDLYLDVRHKLFVKTDGKCNSCGEKLNEDDCILYLKDQDYVLSEANSYILCTSCLKASNRRLANDSNKN